MSLWLHWPVLPGRATQAHGQGSGKDCRFIGKYNTQAASSASASSTHCLSLGPGMTRLSLGEERANRHVRMSLGHRCVGQKEEARQRQLKRWLQGTKEENQKSRGWRGNSLRRRSDLWRMEYTEGSCAWEEDLVEGRMPLSYLPLSEFSNLAHGLQFVPTRIIEKVRLWTFT